MGWTADELKIEQALRGLPLVNISTSKQLEINQVLHERVSHINKKHRTRKFVMTSGVVAAVMLTTMTVYVFSFHEFQAKQNGLTNEHTVRGANPANVSSGYQIPKTITTTNWMVSMTQNNSGTIINPNNSAPRYNFEFSYIGNSHMAENVSIEEKGLVILSPDGKIINSNVFNAGSVSHTVAYNDFTVLNNVSKVEFTISWEAGRKKYTEDISFPRK